VDYGLGMGVSCMNGGVPWFEAVFLHTGRLAAVGFFLVTLVFIIIGHFWFTSVDSFCYPGHILTTGAFFLLPWVHFLLLGVIYSVGCFFWVGFSAFTFWGVYRRQWANPLWVSFYCWLGVPTRGLGCCISDL
jgi:hypothetical protein